MLIISEEINDIFKDRKDGMWNRLNWSSFTRYSESKEYNYDKHGNKYIHVNHLIPFNYNKDDFVDMWLKEYFKKGILIIDNPKLQLDIYNIIAYQFIIKNNLKIPFYEIWNTKFHRKAKSLKIQGNKEDHDNKLICMRCKRQLFTQAFIHLHHIKYNKRKYYGDYLNDKNVIIICGKCHMWIHRIKIQSNRIKKGDKL